MAALTLPSADRIRELFSYSPESGLLTRRPRPRSDFWSEAAFVAWNQRFCNKPIVRKGTGPIQVRVDGKCYLAHRLIFKLQTGTDPTADVDHRNVTPNDNRWTNLRAATRQQNRFNVHPNKTNKIGIKGISSRQMRYGTAYHVSVNGKYRGSYRDLPTAIRVRDEIGQQEHGEFFRAR